MPKCIRVINTTKNIWFKSIQEAAAYAQVDGWTMSKKMEASGSFIDNNGDEYIYCQTECILGRMKATSLFRVLEPNRKGK